jgi:nitrate/nitrite transporter NarK
MNMNEMSWRPLIGLAFGTALGFAGAFGGIGAFIIVLVLGAVGFAAGWALTGVVDFNELLRRRS